MLLIDLLPPDWQKSLYFGQQDGKAALSLAHKNLNNQLRKLWAPDSMPAMASLAPELLASLKTAREELLAEDWQDAETGVYPKSLLFEDDWLRWAQTYPQLWLDQVAVWERMAAKDYRSFAPEIDVQSYPDYYRQNFHYQTDGYLGETSATLYDLQVELLFNGTAEAMRRRLLKPLKTALADKKTPRLLDVACGGGVTLKHLARTFPQASLAGLDLSPAYLDYARRRLEEGGVTAPQLFQGNAEELPFRDDWFDGITCVYLFHELPPQPRQRVLEECYRALKPGGVLVILDSIQLKDRPDWAPMLENFPRLFHEPYYRNYTEDDFLARLEKAGFSQIQERRHCFSKSWTALKPN
ncbi:MAG: methyltransferase domain-containing protein [Cyanobacteria bacterium RI_101]|nr:methyltransferase domain-containing protein [Cyanobacteria bacterium RI_101]